MGSPVSVVVANLVMEDLESKALASFQPSPSIYRRFVDDTISAVKENFIEAFHQHLNAQNPNIQFTLERYPRGGLHFLDSLNRVGDDGTVE